jgi:hypothetical protein
MVFMSHGLMVGLWMASATLASASLWILGRRQKLWSVPLPLIVGGLFGVTLLCRSTGASFLMLVGLGMIFGIRYFRAQWTLTALSIAIVAYVALRTTGISDGSLFISMADVVFPSDRVESLAFRIDNEEILTTKARQRALVGWGGWGRSRVYDQWGQDISITDSRWVILFGTNGLLGVASFLVMLILPIFMLRKRIPPAYWTQPGAVPAVFCAIVVALWAVDNLVNDMFNPVFMLMVGGLSGLRKQVAPLPKRSAHMDAVSKSSSRTAE